MKRATEAGIKKAMGPYYRVEDGVNVISEAESEAAASIIMSEFSGAYCSTSLTKAGTYVFSVESLGKSNKTFFKALVQ